MARPSVRGKLIDAALGTLQARGFNGCSVQDITDAAGVPKGSFYNHFKGKEELAVEALAVYRAHGGSEQLVREPGAKKPPLKLLRGHFEWLAKHLETTGHRTGCLMGTLGAELSGDETPELRAALEDAFKTWSRSVAELLRAAQKEGSLAKKQSPELLGRFVVNAWQGAVARAKLTRAKKPLDDFFETVFETLLK